MADRILTSHAGSLPRPEDLIRLNQQRSAWAKLDALARGAELASQQLWPSRGVSS